MQNAGVMQLLRPLLLDNVSIMNVQGANYSACEAKQKAGLYLLLRNPQ
jgi:hypothetical protein